MDAHYRKLSDANGKYLLDDYVYETRRLEPDSVTYELDKYGGPLAAEIAYVVDISSYRYIREIADTIRDSFQKYADTYTEYEDLRFSGSTYASKAELNRLEQRASSYKDTFNDAMDAIRNPLSNLFANMDIYNFDAGCLENVDRSTEIIALGDDSSYQEWLRDLAACTVGRGGPSQIYWYLEEFGDRLSAIELDGINDMCKADVDGRYGIWDGKRYYKDDFILEELRMYRNDWCDLGRTKYVPSVINPDIAAYCREVPNAVLHNWIKPTVEEAAAVERHYNMKSFPLISEMSSELTDVSRVQEYNLNQAKKGLVKAAPYIKKFLDIKKASPDMLIINGHGTAGLEPSAHDEMEF